MMKPKEERIVGRGYSGTFQGRSTSGCACGVKGVVWWMVFYDDCLSCVKSSLNLARIINVSKTTQIIAQRFPFRWGI